VATTFRPSRRYNAAAAAGPIFAASRVFTWPGIGALAKMPTCVEASDSKKGPVSQTFS